MHDKNTVTITPASENKTFGKAQPEAASPLGEQINFNETPKESGYRASLHPGERVEFFSMRLDINVLAHKLKKDHGFVGKASIAWLWLHMAIDMSSHSILAMDFDTVAPGADTYLSTLAMCCSDKERAAAIVGAERNWKQAATPRVVVTDGSLGFRSTIFREALRRLGVGHVVLAGGQLRSRKAVEAMIHRVLAHIEDCDDLTIWFPSTALPVEAAIGTALTRAVIDHYQSEPMPALSGMSPEIAWHMGCEAHGSPRHLTSEQVDGLLTAARGIHRAAKD